nr:PD-(D/E)XK nuclease family protein [uncultured Niameybacter sp.]
MRDLFQRLDDICNDYVFDEKIILTDTYHESVQILNGYVKQKGMAIHLQGLSIKQWIGNLYACVNTKQDKQLEEEMAIQLVYDVFTRLQSDKVLTYFAHTQPSYEFCKHLLDIFLEIRLAAHTSASIEAMQEAELSKFRDLSQLLKGYEKYLDEYRLYDYASEIEALMKIERLPLGEPVLILKSGLHLSYLENRLLEKIETQIGNERVFKLPLQQVNGINMSPKNRLEEIEWGSVGDFSYIYENVLTTSKPQLEVVSAASEEEEVKIVLENIKHSDVNWEQCVIFYTQKEPYNSILRHLADKLDIPVTLGEGVNIAYTKPGKLVVALLKWIESRYDVADFLQIVEDGLIDFGNGLTSNRVIDSLCKVGIYFGKDRYISQLSKQEEALREQIVKDTNEDKKEFIQQKIDIVVGLRLFFKEVLGEVQDEKLLTYKSILLMIKKVLTQYARTNGALDVQAKRDLLDKIEKMLVFCEDKLNGKNAIGYVKKQLLNLNIQQSHEKPGKVHVTHYRDGVFGTRPYVYIVGLDNENFPGAISEDPLLLDEERKMLGNNMILKKEIPKENLYIMLQLFAQTIGKIHASYTSYDKEGNRSRGASYLFLQCCRIAKENQEIEFNTLKQIVNVEKTIPKIDMKDYWSSKIKDSYQHEIAEELWDEFEPLKYGIEARGHRNSESFTVYEGNLSEEDMVNYDPRVCGEKTISASELEILGKCPYQYFLQSVLNITNKKDVEFSKEQWLDEKNRGILLHAIYEQCYYVGENSTTIFMLSEEDFFEKAENMIEAYAQIIPYWDINVYSAMKKELLKDCKIFYESERKNGSMPCYVEHAFGKEENEVQIVLASGNRIRIAGKIDRIDQNTDQSYTIIDYKTGSHKMYNSKEIFKGGRRIQHMLYPQAFEYQQKGTRQVKKAVYYFPTVKGSGKKCEYQLSDEVKVKTAEVIDVLLDFISKGHFIMTDTEDDCRYCKYGDICRAKLEDPEKLKKHSDYNHDGAERLKGMRSYE